MKLYTLKVTRNVKNGFNISYYVEDVEDYSDSFLKRKDGEIIYKSFLDQTVSFSMHEYEVKTLNIEKGLESISERIKREKERAEETIEKCNSIKRSIYRFRKEGK